MYLASSTDVQQIITLLSLNACGTIAGMGKDLQRAGQVVESEANKKQ